MIKLNQSLHGQTTTVGSSINNYWGGFLCDSAQPAQQTKNIRNKVELSGWKMPLLVSILATILL